MTVPLDPVQIVTGLASPPAVGYLLWRVLPARASFYWMWSAAAIGGAVGSTIPPSAWVQVASNGVSLIIAAIMWWLSRRRRKRAPKLAGAKTKALLAAVVRTMRERSKPRPVFRPQPQGSS
jgi:membrane protein implicated in regulation of membrane protease activity